MTAREKLILSIRDYLPFNREEEKDKEVILEFLETAEDAFLRSNEIAHMTASAWVVNPERTRVLLAYHNIYKSWTWLGGHADGDEDLFAVAVREVCEESGVTNVRAALTGDSGEPRIYSLEILTVEGHDKRGQYVPCHLHFNITYLLEADDDELTRIKPDENSAVGWCSPKEAYERSSEPWFKEHIILKLNRKLETAGPDGSL